MCVMQVEIARYPNGALPQPDHDERGHAIVLPDLDHEDGSLDAHQNRH